MKKIEFTRREKKEQWELLWEQGEFMVERIKGEQVFSLYSLGLTYIEVTFDLESELSLTYKTRSLVRSLIMSFFNLHKYGASSQFQKKMRDLVLWR